MATAIVQQGQSLMDISIEKCGSVTALFELALANGLSITDDVEVGTTLQLPIPTNAAVKQYFENKGIVPATIEAAAKQFENLNPQGIGYWEIGNDFIVQ